MYTVQHSTLTTNSKNEQWTPSETYSTVPYVLLYQHFFLLTGRGYCSTITVMYSTYTVYQNLFWQKFIQKKKKRKKRV